MERAELEALVSATGCAEQVGDMVFLCDPRWGADERDQVRRLQLESVTSVGSAAERGWLCVPTGGTSGLIRFARHDERTIGAAIEGFLRRFGLRQVNAIDVLPPFHVSGLMARARCAATRGTHVQWDWKRLEAGERPTLDARIRWVISLVPTQLQRLMESAEATEWLHGFEIIFLGGGPAWPEVLDRAASAGLRLVLSYGMTETAAMVAAQRPEEFLAGGRSSGGALPHAAIGVTSDGLIRVSGASVFYGYFPTFSEERTFTTADLGTIDAHGRLQVLGRGDAVIITGGEKVNPAEVEAVLRATREFADVAVIGIPDAQWGEAVVACFPSDSRAPDLGAVDRVVSEKLASFKRPKRYLAIEPWPRNAQGKLRRTELRDVVIARLPGK